MRYVMLAVVLLARVGLASFEVTLQPDNNEGNDSFTRAEYPDSDYRDETFFGVIKDSSYAFIEFRELDDYVGQGYTVLSAELWLTLFNNWKDSALIQTRPLSEEEIWIAPVDAAWEEMTITWNNQPGIYETYAVGRSFKEPEPEEKVYVSFDIYSIVQSWLNSDLVHNGIRLYNSIIGGISSDTNIYTWQRPKLILELYGTAVIETSFGQIKALYR